MDTVPGNWPLRAVLYTPGSDPRKVQKALSLTTDAVVLDLEDAVAEAEKDSARCAVASVLAARSAMPVGVRVNGPATARFVDDIRAVAVLGLDFIDVPKVETSEALEIADALLCDAERAHHLRVNSIRVLASIETARGLAAVHEIARAIPGRLLTLMFGSVDLSLDLGLDPNDEAGKGLLYARSHTVVAARAAGLHAPIDGPFLEIRDLRSLHANTIESRLLGFGGRVVIHPDQLQIVTRAYGELSSDEINLLTDIVREFEAQETQGKASIQVNGQFVDYPIYESAKQRLWRHEKAFGGNQ